MDAEYIISLIDNTAIDPFLTFDDIRKFCDSTAKHGMKRIFVNPCHVAKTVDYLKKSDVVVGTVVGFPLGTNLSGVKSFECEEAIREGAREIDMVINLGALKAKDYTAVRRDIRAVVSPGKRHKVPIKVIIEACYLTDKEKIVACELAVEAGANFVKTSTGLGPSGATVKDVRLMRKTVGKNFGVKASGGIRDLDTAIKMIEAGANRIGTSSGAKIASEAYTRL